MASRLAQVSGHVTNACGRGLLDGEVAIITGAFAILLPIVMLTAVRSRCRTGV